MKRILLLLLMLPSMSLAQIRTVTPTGGGIQPDDRTPFLTALGANSIGRNMFQMPNPNAVRYLRANSDNSVTWRTASEFLSDIGGGGGGTPLPEINFVMEGDSLFQGVNSGGATSGNFLHNIIGNYPFFAGRTTVTNFATAGHLISNVISDYPTQARTLRPSANGGKPAIYCLLIGTNDADPLSQSSALLAHCNAALADGFEVWLCTLLPRGAAGSVVQWEAFNRVLRDSNNYSKLIEFNSLFKDSTNTALMGDNLHLSNLGYILMAGYLDGRGWSNTKREALNFGSMAKQDAAAVAINGGTITNATVTATGQITRTATGASYAQFVSFAQGAGLSRQWGFGHEPNAVGSLPGNAFRMDYYNGTAWENGLCGFGPDGRIIGKQLRLTAIPSYANDAAADADAALLSGQFYKITGTRTILQKP